MYPLNEEANPVKTTKKYRKKSPQIFTETDLPLCRHEQLKGEEKATEDQIKVNAEAVESLVRILSKWQNFFEFSKLKWDFRNLDQQLFNKANEIQEEISKKR